VGARLKVLNGYSSTGSSLLRVLVRSVKKLTYLIAGEEGEARTVTVPFALIETLNALSTSALTESRALARVRGRLAAKIRASLKGWALALVA
jgi:hypothetical protein